MGRNAGLNGDDGLFGWPTDPVPCSDATSGGRILQIPFRVAEFRAERGRRAFYDSPGAMVCLRRRGNVLGKNILLGLLLRGRSVGEFNY